MGRHSQADWAGLTTTLFSAFSGLIIAIGIDIDQYRFFFLIIDRALALQLPRVERQLSASASGSAVRGMSTRRRSDCLRLQPAAHIGTTRRADDAHGHCDPSSDSGRRAVLARRPSSFIHFG